MTRSKSETPNGEWALADQPTRFYGKKHTSDLLFADADGSIASGMTNAQLYKGKLYLTGLTTPSLAVCEHPNFRL